MVPLGDEDEDGQTVIGGALYGPYRIQGEIGRGGMATVFEAVDTRTGALAAVKVLHRHVAETSEVVSRFEREARALKTLKSPHIVRVLDFGVMPDGDAWMALERLKGGSLDALLRIESKLEPARALRLARDVALALGAVHAHGMVHRDIKPENVFVVNPDMPSETAKLIDFGVARVTYAEMGAGSVEYTRVAAMIGTAAFVSPEQAQGEEVDARSDIFSLGVTLYEMLTGRLPFEGQTGEEQVKARLEGKGAPIRKRLARERIAPAVADLIERALSHDPRVRPADGTAMAQELEALLENPAGPARPSVVPEGRPSRPQVSYADPAGGFTLGSDAARRRKELALAVLALVVLALLAAGTLAALRAWHALDS